MSERRIQGERLTFDVKNRRIDIHTPYGAVVILSILLLISVIYCVEVQFKGIHQATATVISAQTETLQRIDAMLGAIKLLITKECKGE